MCGLQQQHTSRQLTATTACKISLRNAAVAESHQIGFTSIRSEKCKTQVQSMVRVQSISPRPQLTTFLLTLSLKKKILKMYIHIPSSTTTDWAVLRSGCWRGWTGSWVTWSRGSWTQPGHRSSSWPNRYCTSYTLFWNSTSSEQIVVKSTKVLLTFFF